MIQGQKVLALIPARGGSKGIKNKNITNVEGKPLIAYTIEAALGCEYVDDVVVSTDSFEIRDVAVTYGALVPFMRPASISMDTSKTIEVVINAIEELSKQGREYDVLVLLQPTSPLRDNVDICGAISKYMERGKRSLVAVSEVDDNPILMRTITDDGNMNRVIDSQSTFRRQDMPNYYRVNGSIYINSIEEINMDTSFNDNEVPFILQKTHAVDVDEPKDLELVRFYLRGACE